MMMLLLMNSFNSKNMHHVFSLLLAMALLLRTSTCSKCPASSCGDLQNISFPFRLKSDPKGCGHPRYELTCENNRAVLYLWNGGRYYVRSIYYDSYGYGNGEIRVADDGLQNDNCSLLPRHSSTWPKSGRFGPYYWQEILSVTSLNCSKPASSPSYVNAIKPCTKTTHNSSSNIAPTNNYYLYVVLDASTSTVEDFCTVGATVPTCDSYTADEKNSSSYSYDRIHNMMVDGFNISYYVTSTPLKWRIYLLYSQFVNYVFRRWFPSTYLRAGSDLTYILGLTAVDFTVILAQIVAAKFIVGAPFVLIFLIYKWQRRHLAADANIEKFLQANNNFLPIRYSYYDIKKITKNFKHKLGEGGYGFVYRGKLKSGIEVAVKVLKKSKGNGQDFISEVATIGRIHHVNVVQLVGFCIEGSKQALVYYFMPNGSLDKHIFSKVDGTLLNCKKNYEIALGVARGIEYLHQGCDMQILHFDIKPHNILLDDNFTPKISDFGLARLYPSDCNIVSLTAAKGTLGYMAPEFFYRDIGGISYKADVYSFGMLLMEMAGRRRNINANTEHSSRIYFPLWIYDQLKKGEEEPKELFEEEDDITKKMIIIALWCIQLNPNHRPSMKRVINILQGDIAQLQIPPKPLLYPTDPVPIVGDGDTEIELETFSSSSRTSVTSACHQFENTNELREASAL